MRRLQRLGRATDHRGRQRPSDDPMTQGFCFGAATATAWTSWIDRRLHRPAVHLAGIAGKNRLPSAIGVRDVRGIAGGRRSSAPRQATQQAILQGFYGSDWTRTRDLRRDRPSQAPRRLATNSSKQPICRAFRLRGQARCRMVVPIVQSTFGATSGPRSCHGRQHHAPEQSRLTPSQCGAVVCLCGSYRICMSTGVGHVAG